jgi:ferric-dicitrate binding protein FerR (iron transport regulator)
LDTNATHINDALVKYLLQEASVEEMATVEAWVAAAAENQAYFDQFRTIWERSKALSVTSTADENVAWQRFQNRIHARPVVKSPAQFAWMRVAALVVVIIGAGLAAYYSLREKPAPLLTAQATGTVKSNTLSDGSVVTLNKNSSITYPQRFEGDARSVELKGEAFFDVTPNKSKPFIIRINDVTVTVVGTSFNIRSENGTTEVIVATGVVQVQRRNKTLTLRPNEKITVKQQDSLLVKAPETTHLYNYYQSNEFVCDNTPLWKLVAVLNKAYNVNIVIGRDSLRALPLTTTFPNESLDHILQVICLTFNLKAEHTSTAIILN